MSKVVLRVTLNLNSFTRSTTLDSVSTTNPTFRTSKDFIKLDVDLNFKSNILSEAAESILNIITMNKAAEMQSQIMQSFMALAAAESPEEKTGKIKPGRRRSSTRSTGGSTAAAETQESEVRRRVHWMIDSGENTRRNSIMHKSKNQAPKEASKKKQSFFQIVDDAGSSKERKASIQSSNLFDHGPPSKSDQGSFGKPLGSKSTDNDVVLLKSALEQLQIMNYDIPASPKHHIPYGYQSKGPSPLTTPSVTPERRRSSTLAASRSALAVLTKELLMRRRRRRARPLETYTDKDRAASVNLGTQDIKQSLKARKHEDRSYMLDLPDDVKPSTILALAEKQMQFGHITSTFSMLTKALEMQPAEKRCLAARSRCLFLLGDYKGALKDAEKSLAEDEKFVPGILQKAEAMYHLGDFEHALIHFHHGNRIRPDIQEFIIGIQKSKEAINNAIGNRKVKPLKDLEKMLPELTLNGETKVSEMTVKKLTWEKIAKAAVKQQGQSSIKGKKGESRPRVPYVRKTGAELVEEKKKLRRKTREQMLAKELLGEMYADKEYLEKFVNQPSFRLETDKNSKLILACAEEALTFLNSRQEFWRQQKPVYAREYEKKMSKIQPRKL